MRFWLVAIIGLSLSTLLKLPIAYAEMVVTVQKNAVKTAAQATAPIYTWKTETGRNQAGQFEFCLLRNMLDNGLNLQLAGNAKNQKYLALQFAQNKLTFNEKYPLVWQVDNGVPQAVVARAVNAQTLNLPLAADQLNALANGQNLSLTGPTDRLDISLTGISGTVLALQDCLQVHGGIDDTSLQPPPTIKTAPTTQASDVHAEEPLQKELPRSILQRFDQAGLAATQLVVVPASQRHKLPLDFAWDVRNLFVGYKAVDGTLEDFTFFMQAYLQGLKTLCAGQMRAETAQILSQPTPQTPKQAVDVACDHQGQITVTALLFEHTQKQHHVFFVEAPANQGAQALKARNKL